MNVLEHEQPAPSAVSSLNQAYGGELVNRIEPRPSDLPSRAPVLSVDSIAESDFINLATGVFSPLRGFMGSADFQSVCASNRLAESGLPWTIPIVLDIAGDEKKLIGKADMVLIRSGDTGKNIGAIYPNEIYSYDKQFRAVSTFGVADEAHPGAKYVLGRGPYLLGGEVVAFADVLSTDPLAYPHQVRKRLQTMGLSKVAGFQTRNVVHRSHEYLQRVALEVCGGLLIQPVIGWKKTGDFKAEVIRHSYTKFVAATYPADKVLLAFLRLAMRYAGPKEAVLHAIVRKNFGCSHFIVGRDHAGVGGYYPAYAAHQIFSTLPGLGIEILKLSGPFFCHRCGGIATDQTCGHPDRDREQISATNIRQILTEGGDPSHLIFRKEVLEDLKSFRNDGWFYE